MAYCTQCGKEVRSADIYCGCCGMRQPASSASIKIPPPPPDFLQNITPRTASLLCYIPFVGWVASLVILSTNRFKHDYGVRFHAFQGLFLYIAWLMLEWVLDPVFVHLHGTRWFPSAGKLVVVIAWIMGMVRTSQDQPFRIPVVGDIAEKAATEQ
jgi:uncharacterized membrane protein